MNNSAAYDPGDGIRCLSDEGKHRAVIGKDVGAKTMDAITGCDLNQPLKQERRNATTAHLVKNKECNIRRVGLFWKHCIPAFGYDALSVTDPPRYDQSDMPGSIDVAQIIQK